MARVVAHAVKQATLNLKDMIEKKSLGIELEDIKEIIEKETNGMVWLQDDEKPEILNTVIEQIRGLFNVGKEVSGWTVTYLGPPSFNSGSKNYTPSETRIKAGGKGMGGRFILMVGSRDIVNLQLSVGSTEAENAYMILSGDCLQLKITVCPVMDVYFNNINNEKLAPRKGFRETVIKKTVQNRHVFVFDAHVETSEVISHIKDKLVGNSTQ